MRDGLLLIHIIGVAGWLGGGFYGIYAYSTVARVGSPIAGLVLRAYEKRAGVYFGIFSGLVILSGVALVLTSDAYGWTDTFVLIGLGAFVLSGVLQSVVGRKANQRLIDAGTSGQDVPQALRAWQRTSSIDVVVLVFVIWTMISKLGAG